MLMRTHSQEPGDPEDGGVGGVDDGVESEEGGERETLEGRLGADVRGEIDG